MNDLIEQAFSITAEIQEEVTKKWEESMKMKDEFLIAQLREFAVPKIKGEITKGKIKWRGIRLNIVQKEGGQFGGRLYYLTQRGKQIGGEYTEYYFSLI